MLFGHVINVANTLNDHFYQGILSGHIASGVMILIFLYKNKTLSRSTTAPSYTENKVEILID